MRLSQKHFQEKRCLPEDILILERVFIVDGVWISLIECRKQKLKESEQLIIFMHFSFVAELIF